ncbi:MAG: alpha/beta hydrolase [Flavobacteriales bacterium]|nr:alpha/beta hydrolase [Flavobacteriales bacterium]
MKNIILILLTALTTQIVAQKKITFKATDSLKITADLYIENSEKAPLILLFHQAGWSRGEYKEIAPKLNKLGFNCIAFDQRSGGEVNDVINETHQRAKKQKLGTNYVDALVDITSSIDYAKKKYGNASKLIIWGSSYSAGLVLKLAGEQENIDAVLAFSPGEYYKKLGKPADWIAQSAKNIEIPVFITSAKLEKKSWWKISEVIPSEQKAYFLPQKMGKHGSRALWEKFSDHKAYWKAVTNFLDVIK